MDVTNTPKAEQMNKKNKMVQYIWLGPLGICISSRMMHKTRTELFPITVLV